MRDAHTKLSEIRDYEAGFYHDISHDIKLVLSFKH